MGRLLNRLIYYRKINALKRTRFNYHTISDTIEWLDAYISLYGRLGSDIFKFENTQNIAIVTNYKNIAELFDTINIAKEYLDDRIGKLSLNTGEKLTFTFSKFKTNKYNMSIQDEVIQEYLQTLVIPYLQTVVDIYKSGYPTVIGKQKLLLVNIITLLKVIL